MSSYFHPSEVDAPLWKSHLQTITSPQKSPTESDAAIRFGILGIGGGGCNAVKNMARFKWSDHVDFICIETDTQKLHQSNVLQNIITLQLTTTRGQGAGMIPEQGRRAAQAAKDKLSKLLEKYNAVFLVAGMGGGTGTGASPVIAELAKDSGALTIGVVTKPFSWETDRFAKAEKGIEQLKRHVHSLISISNIRVEQLYAEDSMENALHAANTVLNDAVRSITNLVLQPSEINIDFADICSVLESSPDNPLALIGFGDSRYVNGNQQNLLEKTVALAIDNPILENCDLAGCTGILVNITVNAHANFPDVCRINDFIQEKLRDRVATEQFLKKTGYTIDDSLDDGVVQVTVIAAGITQNTILSGSRRVPDFRVLRNPMPPKEISVETEPESASIGLVKRPTMSHRWQNPILHQNRSTSGRRRTNLAGAKLVSTMEFLRRQQGKDVPLEDWLQVQES